jgi:hypothetical protein
MQRSTAGVLLLVLGVALGVFVTLPFSAGTARSCGPAVLEARKSAKYRPASTNPIDQGMASGRGQSLSDYLAVRDGSAIARPCVGPARRRLEIAGVLGVAGAVLIVGIPMIVKRDETAGRSRDSDAGASAGRSLRSR